MAQEDLDHILVWISKNDVPIYDSHKYRFQDDPLGEFMLIVVLFPGASD